MSSLILKQYQSETLDAPESFLSASTTGDLAGAYAQTLAMRSRRVSRVPNDGGEAPYRDTFAKAEGASAELSPTAAMGRFHTSKEAHHI